METLESKKYQRVKKRVEEIKGFYWHLFASCLAIPIVLIVNYLTTEFPWSLIASAAILLSIGIHWFVVFKRGSFFTHAWEDKKIQEFMKEDNDQQKRLFD